MAYWSRPEEILKDFQTRFKSRADQFGINFIGIQDENLLTEYPALRISQGPVLREIHGTQKYLVTFEISFWIYHANYESTYAQRSIEDMELATDIVRYLHSSEVRVLQDDSNPDPNPNRILFGFVTQEIPGRVARVRSSVIVTRLVWQGQSEVNYNDA
jgi:hypothetical protein